LFCTYCEKREINLQERDVAVLAEGGMETGADDRKKAGILCLFLSRVRFATKGCQSQAFLQPKPPEI
jgi:hypothetical protein